MNGTPLNTTTQRSQNRLALLIVWFLSLAVAAPAHAGTKFVDDDAPNDPGPGDPLVSDPLEDGTSDHPFDSIQEAILAAVSGADEVLVHAGIYRGPGNVNIDFLGKAITVRSFSGPAATVVDCENQTETRGFIFQTNEWSNSVLQGFMVTGGNMDGADPAQRRGGALYCELAHPTIRNCWFVSNSAFEGGGLAGSSCSPLVSRCRFEQNIATGDGGGLFNVGGYPTIVNSVFLENSAGESGGALYSLSCSFGDGPGPELFNTLLVNNTAGGFGGGIASNEYCPTVLTHCTVSGNTASIGGGLAHDFFSQLAIRNSVFWSNTPDSIDTIDGKEPHIATIFYSDIAGGAEGEGNLDTDPFFADPSQLDFRLSMGSPCIDSTGPNQIHGDPADLDDDGELAEPLPLDLGEMPRLVGAAPDMGAFEFQEAPCSADLDGDGEVRVPDLIILLGAWGPNPGHSADLDGDGEVRVPDLIILLGTWGPCA